MKVARLAGGKPAAGVPGVAMGTPNADCAGEFIICWAKAGGRLIVAVVIP